MITRTFTMHDVNVVRMTEGQPELSTVKGYVGDISKPNKVLETVQEYDSSIIAITGFSEAYTKRYGMDEGLFISHAKCLDD